MLMAKTNKLTKNDVLHVAQLSNLQLTEEEIEKFTSQLTQIVEFVGELSEVDTSGVDDSVNVTGLTNVMAEDEINVINTLPVDKATSATNRTHNDLFMVPAILEGRTDK